MRSRTAKSHAEARRCGGCSQKKASRKVRIVREVLKNKARRRAKRLGKSHAEARRCGGCSHKKGSRKVRKLLEGGNEVSVSERNYAVRRWGYVRFAHARELTFPARLIYSFATGNRSVNAVPFPTAESTRILPPCF